MISGILFAQYVKVKDNQLYLLEQSEGSRCTTLSRYDTVSKAVETDLGVSWRKPYLFWALPVMPA